jgi:hypothetical protein
MPTLTLDAIIENPASILTHELPEHPTRLMLTLAELAAALCRQMQDEIIEDSDRNRGGTALERNVKTAAIKRWTEAYRKQGEIGKLLEEKFGLSSLKFWLERYAK